jgi:hypothetical protein
MNIHEDSVNIGDNKHPGSLSNRPDGRAAISIAVQTFPKED